MRNIVTYVHVTWSLYNFFQGAGTFGTVRAGIYKPKTGGPEVKCAIKCLKPAEELPNQKVCKTMSFVSPTTFFKIGVDIFLLILGLITLHLLYGS